MPNFSLISWLPKSGKLYFVILLGRFPLVRKIKKIFGHFFHFIAVQKVISRHIFRRRGAEGPETSKNVSRNHFLNQDKMEKWSNFSKFLLNKCMKTIQVMQQTIFFYFGIDLRTTFQSPTDGRACQGRQIFFKILSKWLPKAAILKEFFLRKSLACSTAYGGRHPSGATGTWS